MSAEGPLPLVSASMTLGTLPLSPNRPLINCQLPSHFMPTHPSLCMPTIVLCSPSKPILSMTLSMPSSTLPFFIHSFADLCCHFVIQPDWPYRTTLTAAIAAQRDVAVTTLLQSWPGC